jgi:RNA polymerase sigma-70 factor (ECF subfamily)
VSRSVLRITTSENDNLVELRIEGDLTQSTTHEVDRLCCGYLEEGRKLALQLAGATFADRAGAELLRDLKKRGVMLTECSGFLSELLRDSPEPLVSPVAPRDDDALIGQLKAHNEEAFEATVRQYGPRMLATARRFLGNEHDAADAVQQAFISAFKSIGAFNAHAKLSTWLHRIVVNAALAVLRARRHRPELSIENLLPHFDDAGGWPDTTEEMGWGIEHPMERRENRQMVRRCIDRLPQSYRSVLLLRDIEELDSEEAAQMLAITPNAAKIRLHRARQALKTLIEKELFDSNQFRKPNLD